MLRGVLAGTSAGATWKTAEQLPALQRVEQIITHFANMIEFHVRVFVTSV